MAVQHDIEGAEDECVLVRPDGEDGALTDGERAVGDDLVHVHAGDVAQPSALGAGALRRVEREVMGCRLAVGKARDGVHEALAVVAHGTGVLVEQHQQPVALHHSGRHAVAQPLVVLRLHLQLVDDHLDVVVLVAVNLQPGHRLADFAIDADVEVALAAHLLEQLAVVALSAAHQRSEYHHRPPLVLTKDKLDDFLLGVLHHTLAGLVGIGVGSTGIEQTEVVIDLGGRTDGGTGIFVCRFLFDGDDGAETGDLIDIGPPESAEEVAGIGREGLDVAALAFGEEGVESQRRLARAAQPRDDG